MTGSQDNPGSVVPPRGADAAHLSRRQAIRLGVAGLAGLGGVGSLVWHYLRTADRANPSGIFTGSAPTGELWDLWKKRGWAREAYHYVKLGPNVLCKLCPNDCLLEPGDRGRCRNRVNKGGTLYTLAYANPCAIHVDPVEKKPLFHFLPGSRSFSLATAGCVFRCLNCQNWDISQRTPEETKDPRGPEYRLRPPMPRQLSMDEVNRLSLFPEDAVAVSEALQCPSISYTYSEPTAFYEYAYDTCKLARQRGRKNIFVTCGSIKEEALRDVGRYLDAAHVDLKGFDEQTYWRLNAGRLRYILATLKTLQSLGVWFEVINLVVPTYTDNLDGIARMCDWLVQNVGPDHPLHFSRFHPAHKLNALPPTPVETLVQARAIAQAAGLRYVYLGNVRDVPDAETTFCPNCKRAVVRRDVFAVTNLEVVNGRCRFCQTAIAGVWS